jgi:hypothetical protein
VEVPAQFEGDMKGEPLDGIEFVGERRGVKRLQGAKVEEGGVGNGDEESVGLQGEYQ